MEYFYYREMHRRSARNRKPPSPVPDQGPSTSTGKRGNAGGGPSSKKKKEEEVEVEVTRPSLRKEKGINQKNLEEMVNLEEEEEFSYSEDDSDFM